MSPRRRTLMPSGDSPDCHPIRLILRSPDAHAMSNGVVAPRRVYPPAQAGSGLVVEERSLGPPCAVRAQELTDRLLRPAAALEVAGLLRRDSSDLNVRREAIHRGYSRWTLQRRCRLDAGACPKELVALARIMSVLGRMSHRIDGCDRAQCRTTRPLLRAERRAVRVWLGISSEALAQLLQDGGLRSVQEALSRRFSALMICGETASLREPHAACTPNLTSREPAVESGSASAVPASRHGLGMLNSDAEINHLSTPPAQSRSAGSPTSPRRSR